jgi:tRNA 2-thiouridine synthesizing protein A
MVQPMAQLLDPKPDAQLDLRGYRCPIPALKARKRLETMELGERLEILADDPVAKIDMPHFCAEAGHVLEHAAERGGTFAFVIRKGKDVRRSAP